MQNTFSAGIPHNNNNTEHVQGGVSIIVANKYTSRVEVSGGNKQGR